MIRTYRHNAFLLLLLFPAFIALWSCKKDSKETGIPQSNSLILSDNEAYPYQFIQLELPEGSVPADTSSAYVTVNAGGITVQAFRVSGSIAYRYQLNVPELAPGSHTLSVATDKGSAEAAITIKQQQLIADADVYLDNFETETDADVAAELSNYDDRVQAGTLRQGAADTLKQFIQAAVNKNKLLVASLPADEKLKYAYMIQANKYWLDEYNAVSAQYPLSNGMRVESDCEELRSQESQARNAGYDDDANSYRYQAEQCEAGREQQRVRAGNRFRERINTAYDEAKVEFDARPGAIKASWAFVSTFVTAAGKGLIEEATGIKDLNDPFAIESLEDVEKRAAISFDEGKEYEFASRIKLVNMNRSNAHLFPEFKEMIADIDFYNIVMEKVSRFLPYKPEMEVPSPRSSQLLVSEFTVDQVSDPGITHSFVDGGKGKKIKFSTTSLTDNTEFTFRVGISSRFGSAVKTVSAELKFPPIELRQLYQGGIVFYVDATGRHGLIASLADQNPGGGWMAPGHWGCLYTHINGAYRTAIGGGQANTTDMLNGCADKNTAAVLCSEYKKDGYDDWFMPSRDELNEMYKELHLKGLGSFESDIAYFSSSQYNSDYAWGQFFVTGYQGQYVKGTAHSVRAIRAF